MKKLILSLIAICSVYVATAQSCVSVQQVSTNYAAKQITFDLKWGTCNNTNHLYRVWVFVDYRLVTITTKGAWGRAVITATDKGTLVSANKGVWVTGSANATQRVTLTLDIIGDKFDWCAFAIDYPPNAILNNGVYTLKGTPPFIINNNITWSANTYTGNITAITDATNNPDGFFDIPDCSTNMVNLGTAGFTSTQTWRIGAQTWSAPVTATYCNKTTYSGGSSGAYNSDCRSGIQTGYGDFFSWCMVARHAATLCPSPWRVPTGNDFCILDKTLNSRSDCAGMRDNSTEYNRFMDTWGGNKTRFSDPNGALFGCSMTGGYYAVSEQDIDYGHALYFSGGSCSYTIRLMYDSPQKNYGYALRCVK